MSEFLLAILFLAFCAFVAYKGVEIGNAKFPDLNMSPKWSAVIGFLFGTSGLVGILLYAVIKLLIKKMNKH